MEESFDGLDCRLRVSGMVADSIMMGIVNAAMEEAYEKSCSKEGALERLNEKSRFCELAIMQLEWCLKFLQEEMDSYMAESTLDREKLLADLLETRNRIHNRLKETELTIADKDRELIGRIKSEKKLRMALRGKDEEISCLSTACKLERGKSEALHSFFPCGLISEVKNGVDQQILETRSRLVESQGRFNSLLQNLSVCSLGLQKLELGRNLDGEECRGNSEGKGSTLVLKQDENDGFKAVTESIKQSAEQLKKEFDGIAMNFGILKGKLDSSFDMMENCVSLFEASLEEQQWKWNIERESTDIIIGSFLRSIQYELSQHRLPVDNFPPTLLHKNWSSLLDDIKSLYNELEMLVVQKDAQPIQPASSIVNRGGRHECKKNLSLAVEAFLRKDEVAMSERVDDDFSEGEQHEGPSESSSKIGRLSNPKNQPKGNPLKRSVAEIIRNHEFVIRQKSEEINCLKVELSRGKASSALRNDVGLNCVKDMLPGIIFRLNSIIKENAKFTAAYQEQKMAHEREQNVGTTVLLEIESVSKEEKMAPTTNETSKKSDNRLCCHVSGADLCNEIKNLKQEVKDLDIKAKMTEETYVILLKGLLTTFHLQSLDCILETHIREDTHRIIHGEIVEEWKTDREVYSHERSVMEEVERIVFSEVLKNVESTVSLALTKYRAEYLPAHNNLLRTPDIIEGLEAVRDVDILLNDSIDSKYFQFNSKLAEQDIIKDSVVYEPENSNEQYHQLDEPIDERNDAFGSVDRKLEKFLQQKPMSNMQLRELASRLGSNNDDKDAIQEQVDSTSHAIEKKYPICLSTNIGERQWKEMQVLLLPLLEFSHVFRDFEHVACQKISKYMSRLQSLNSQLDPFIEQVNSIKKKELLYRKAFTRRCYDLQTAETEVDLLGDEVDLLLGLLEKIYAALNHYSPVLQHYFGIMDVLRLIRKELNGEAIITS